jgi:hypothetical protein
MKIDFDISEIFQYFKKGQVGAFVGIFKDKIHVTHWLVVMNA